MRLAKQQLQHQSSLEAFAKSKTISQLEEKIVELKSAVEEQTAKSDKHSKESAQLSSQLSAALATVASKTEEERKRERELTETRRAAELAQSAQRELETIKGALEAKINSQLRAIAELESQIADKAESLVKLEKTTREQIEMERKVRVRVCI